MHTCPDCGQACYCCGDIDDIEVDPTAASRCIHCDLADVPYHADEDDADDPESDDLP